MGQIVPWTSGTTTVPFRILRSPVKAGATPLQLPAGSVVDLEYSGSTASGPTGQQDLTVLFSPNGAVASVYYGGVSSTVTDPVYLLIGNRIAPAIR